jgi:hypothetical protein
VAMNMFWRPEVQLLSTSSRRNVLWKSALRGEILSSHPGQWYETVRQRIAD